jgi:hypothetical protein
MINVFVRAQTADDRWASVNIADLDDRSFRLFVGNALSEAGIVYGLTDDTPQVEVLKTHLTKEQVEASD